MQCVWMLVFPAANLFLDLVLRKMQRRKKRMGIVDKAVMKSPEKDLGWEEKIRN